MKPSYIFAPRHSFSDYVVQKFAAIGSELPQSQLPAGDASSAAVASTSQSAGAVWNGVERRSQVDRRQQNRRQERGSAMLDTRTQPDRRCEARRQTDRAVNAFVACKV